MQVLKDYKLMIAQLEKINQHLDGSVELVDNSTEGSADPHSIVHIEELQATQAFLQSSIQQACEWVSHSAAIMTYIILCSF